VRSSILRHSTAKPWAEPGSLNQVRRSRWGSKGGNGSTKLFVAVKAKVLLLESEHIEWVQAHGLYSMLSVGEDRHRTKAEPAQNPGSAYGVRDAAVGHLLRQSRLA
jgi:hypothetical protein